MLAIVTLFEKKYAAFFATIISEFVNCID